MNVSNSLNSLTIVSYNVDGLCSKLSDVDFLSFIDQFDCVCLLETFMIDNTIPLNVFRNFLPAFFFPATPSQGQGRASGGIVVLVKLKFKNIVSRIEIDFHSSIVLFFKNVFFGSKKDLVLISSYIHPWPENVGSTGSAAPRQAGGLAGRKRGKKEKGKRGKRKKKKKRKKGEKGRKG